MDRVTSVEHCKALIAENRRRFSKVDSNCLMMLNSFAPVIGAGRLGYQVYDDGLCLFSDEGPYYKMFYFWDAGAEVSGVKQDKPLLTGEYIDRKKTGGGVCYNSKLQGSLGGFRVLKRNRQYALELPPHRDELVSGNETSARRLAAQGIHIGPCMEKICAAQILALWDQLLAADDIDDKHRRFMTDDTQTVICAQNASGQVVGAYLWEMSRRDSAVGWHLATRTDHHRKGIATAMLRRCAVSLLDGGAQRLYTWIADGNEDSVRTHERLGFRPTGSMSVQYILPGA